MALSNGFLTAVGQATIAWATLEQLVKLMLWGLIDYVHDQTGKTLTHRKSVFELLELLRKVAYQRISQKNRNARRSHCED